MRGRRLRRARLSTKSSSSGLSGSIENPPPPSATMCLAGAGLRFLKFFPALVCTVDLAERVVPALNEPRRHQPDQVVSL
jgi:hypothetical protein